MLLSYQNDPKVKEKYVARVKMHAEADEIIKGQYWENGKGCNIGCAVETNVNPHDKWAQEIGPKWLAYLSDQLFEGIDNSEAKAFPLQFYQAIPVGVNLEPIRWRFCVFLLRENLDRVQALRLDTYLKNEVVDAIRGVLTLSDTGRWDEVESTAWNAGNVAAYAAWSARSTSTYAAWRATWRRYADHLLELLRSAE